MEEIWGKDDMKEKLLQWADIGDMSGVEAGQAALNMLEQGGYHSSVDFPSSPLAVDMARANGKIKVILSVRDSAEVWYESARKTILNETGRSDIDAIFDRFYINKQLNDLLNDCQDFTIDGM